MLLADRTFCAAASSLPCWGRKSVFSSTQPVGQAAGAGCESHNQPCRCLRQLPLWQPSLQQPLPPWVRGLLLLLPGPPSTRRLRPRPQRQPRPGGALPVICGGGCGCGPGRGSTFGRTHSAASWGSWKRKACTAASPAAPAPTRSAAAALRRPRCADGP